MGVAALPGQLRLYNVLKAYPQCESRESLHTSFFLSGIERKGRSKLKGFMSEAEIAIAQLQTLKCQTLL